MQILLASIVVALAGAVPLRAQSVPAGTPVVRLDDAIAIATARNRQVQSAALAEQGAAEVTAAARTRRLPQIGANVLSGMALTPIEFTIPRGSLGVYSIGPLPATDAPITTPRRWTGLVVGTVAQPLTQLFEINLGVQQAAIGEQVARETLRETRQQVVQQVTQGYAQLAGAQLQLEQAERALAFLAELSALTDRRVAAQTALRGDSLAAKARLGQQRYQVAMARDNLTSQKEAFNRLLGRDLDTPFVVEAQPGPAAVDDNLAEAESRALAQRPEFQKARLLASNATLDVRRVRADRFPDVSVLLSYVSFADVTMLPTHIAHLGVNLQWQPFDWGQRRHREAEAGVALRQAELAVRDAEAQIRMEVRTSYRRLLQAQVLVDAADVGREAAREKLRVAKNAFAEEALLPADMLQAESVAAQAEADYQQAVAAFWAARASYTTSLGGD